MDESNNEPPPTVDSLKELGNTAVKSGKFEEAILHYTHAIKRDPRNAILYSNRSFAFLKLQQYSLALEDANETIRLAPEWPKGYFRRAEIESATCNYVEAYNSYETALKFKPDDQNIYASMQKVQLANLRDRKADEQIPWLGSGIGIVIGVIILIADYTLTTVPTHPLIMAILTIAISIGGYCIARVYRSYIKSQRKGLLEPIDLGDEIGGAENGDESENNAETKPTRTSPRYTKSQARQRFKKGKM